MKKVLKEKDKAKKLKARDNGKVYLPAGDYTLIVRQGKTSVKGSFKIKPAPKKQRGKKKTPGEEEEPEMY
ncbi:MAG TPA: hypothetical protein ENJ82_02420 [Bacteroidetes bacterium]|nr:hypothetical protein [Bacteroidota bacterium]